MQTCSEYRNQSLLYLFFIRHVVLLLLYIDVSSCISEFRSGWTIRVSYWNRRCQAMSIMGCQAVWLIRGFTDCLSALYYFLISSCQQQRRELRSCDPLCKGQSLASKWESEGVFCLILLHSLGPFRYWLSLHCAIVAKNKQFSRWTKRAGLVNKTPYSWRKSWCLSGIEMDAEQADFVGQGHRGTSQDVAERRSSWLLESDRVRLGRTNWLDRRLSPEYSLSACP